MAEVMLGIFLIGLLICVAGYLYFDYRERKDDAAAKRRLIRARTRALNENSRAIEDACLECLRRDGYLIRR